MSLAVADLLVVVSAIPEAIMSHHLYAGQWVLGHAGCSLLISGNFLGINASSIRQGLKLYYKFSFVFSAKDQFFVVFSALPSNGTSVSLYQLVHRSSICKHSKSCQMAFKWRTLSAVNAEAVRDMESDFVELDCLLQWRTFQCSKSIARAS